MKLTRSGSAVALLATASMALTACGGNDSPTSTTTTTGTTSGATTGATTEGATTGATDGESAAPVSGTQSFIGASSQESAMKAWIAGFNETNPDAKINYAPEGSGAGVEQFIAGATKLAASDSHLDEKEAKAAEGAKVCGPEGAMNLPVYISPVALPYNLEGVDELKLSPEVIAEIFNGKIKKWNDPKIAADNEGVELPDLAIVAVHRADESGTTENFMEYLTAAAPKAWPHEADKTFPVSGEAGTKTSGVIELVKNTNGAIGYADASAVGELKSVSVGVGEEFVPFSPEAAAAVVDASDPAKGVKEGDLALDLARDTKEGGQYPIVLVSYHIVCKEYKKAEDAEFVKAFVKYVASEEGQTRAADEAGSAPMSAQLREKVNASADLIKAAG